MSEFQITSGEVLEVLYGDSNPNLIYGIKVKPLDGTPSDDETTLSVITAKPLNTSILRIPIKGEVVLLLKAPSSYASGISEASDTYYFDIVSLQSSIHHNALPTVSSRKVQTGQTSGDSDKYNETNSGNTNTQEEPKIDENFSENPTVKPLQPYVGDLLIEGRYGNSIRFSTAPKSGKFTVAPKWSGGSESAPITIFRNSKQETDTQKINDFITEDFTNNENIIVMASGQNIEFEQGSGVVTAIQSKGITSWKDENWGTTPQTLISSGRLVFNSTQKEIIAFAKNGIGLSTETSIAIDAVDTVAINATKIELGDGAGEPLILGNSFKSWAENLIDQLSTLTVITPAGPSSPLSASPQWASISTLKAQLSNLLSDLSFTKKSVSTSSRNSSRIAKTTSLIITPEQEQQVQQLIDDAKEELPPVVDEQETEEDKWQRVANEEFISHKEDELEDGLFAAAEYYDYDIQVEDIDTSADEHFDYIKYIEIKPAQGGTGVNTGGSTGSGTISELFELIAGGEGTYNSINLGTAGDSPGGSANYAVTGKRNLTDISVGELINIQDKTNLNAVGKYQIIPSTMKDFVSKMKINKADKFDVATQERFPEYVVDFKRPIVGQYIKGKSDNKREAAQALAREFASVGLTYAEAGRLPGQTRFSEGGNKASISPQQIATALEKARNFYTNSANAASVVSVTDGENQKGRTAAKAAQSSLGILTGNPVVNQWVKEAGATPPARWCASAVNHWWKQAGLETPPKGRGASVAEWWKWAGETDRQSRTPIVGAVVIYQRSAGLTHCGIVVEINKNDGSYITIEGNTSVPNASVYGVGQKTQHNNVKGFVIPK
jgi:hypothetical protein